MRTDLWFVSRQRYWPDGREVVEIAQGGRDYANPDMLYPKYHGEAEEYSSAVEAVDVAYRILEDWSGDSGHDIDIALGCTMGYTCPFVATDKNEKEMQEWALKFDSVVRDAEDASEEELEAASEIFEGWIWRDGRRVYPDY